MSLRPVHAPGNYLLFRVYEAAKKLSTLPAPRIAVIVVDDQAWHNFELALSQGWICWDAPAFLGDETTWQTFLKAHWDVLGAMDFTTMEVWT